ncbi:hexose carrier protein HEX6-like isoform X1 [Olea europaea var. sylvestris]|uniref:Hexose carrier HEX6-like n=2 Tax=Olea europaea subsp. europaea TaxID=158383 RepID=A0A8S0PBZ2_OLEEU|nr:hexose carrier protein HEX6-like isoform X1 [Olea europaea var. sylvestris]XP_022856825.1 hexose carrier protein HEX6-like isoform X1 [Olea europaea var. sylvestris]CAA2935355.1 hexose carrier HEX6-like [Olea europaea subsp. europaea]
MALGFVITSTDGQYNGRITLFVALSCMMASMGGVIFGYDIGISGGVTSMEPFLKKFFPEVYTRMKEDTEISNYCKFDSQLLTLFTSSLYIAGLIASFFASLVTAAYGRKPSILAGGAAFLAGAALGGAAVNIYMLIFGRVLLGVGVGFSNQAVPLYLSEMAPPKCRGAINNSFQFSVGIGALAANLINYGTEKIKGGSGWRISLAMAAFPASILTLGALFLPETPNSLIQRSSNHEKAKKMLQRVRGTDDVQAELDDLIKANDVSKTTKNPYKNIIQRKYRPQFVMSIAIPFFQQVTGINVIAFYAPILFRTIGLGISASLLSAVVTGVVGIGTTFISMLIVDKVGRRFLLIMGGIQMFVSQLTVGGIMAAKLGDHDGLNKSYAFLILVLICIYVAGFGISWGPLGWLIPSEIFPLEIRSAGQSISVGINFLFTFVVGQTFLSMLCHFKSGIFFFFGGWVAIMTAFVVLLLPETKNLPIEQMDRIWKEHWFWKKIVENNEEVLGKVDGESRNC